MRAMVLTAQAKIDSSRSGAGGSRAAGARPRERSTCACERAAPAIADLHVVEGDIPPRRLPLIPGIRSSACRAPGPAHGVALADRVGIAWLRSTRALPLRISGRENLCAESAYTG
jgi:propanol-preferring alcohol dehydrogenase